MLYRNKQLIDRLYTIEGKAEIVNDMIVVDSPTGGKPGRAAAAIYRELYKYEVANRDAGYAIADNVAFLVDLPNRQSFCPDAAWFTGEMTMKFLEGAPVFAAEVRSEGDYRPAAESRIAAKRDDYFAAGTLVIWDVDLLGDDVVRVYTPESRTTPRVYKRGESAEAEPAVPGWSMPVDEMF